ncbi:MAG: hypothetical protein NC089_01795 [Bacteroides sp.]|nr:hypothetical protein [Bacteroides sp.]MCM1548857.1 hypothetical protein [Clostridium sp.]
MKKVYICAPLGGNVSVNLRKAQLYAKYAFMCGMAPVVPHFYALVLNDDEPKERELGRRAGMSLLWLCDEMWVFGNTISSGMEAEIMFCKNLNIRIRMIRDEELAKELGNSGMEGKNE